MRFWLLGVCAAVALGSCTSSAQAYDDPQDVVAALADADIACEDLEDVRRNAQPPAARTLVARRGTCRVGRVEVVINLFGDAQDRADWIAVVRLLGPVAYGPNWAVSSGSPILVRDIAEALDAWEAGHRG